MVISLSLEHNHTGSICNCYVTRNICQYLVAVHYQCSLYALRICPQKDLLNHVSKIFWYSKQIRPGWCFSNRTRPSQSCDSFAQTFHKIHPKLSNYNLTCLLYMLQYLHFYFICFTNRFYF